MAPLNLTGPENPGCAAGEAVQVYACVLELDVDVPEGPAIELVVELESMADELEVPGTGLEVAIEEVAVVDVGRTIGVVLRGGVTEVTIEEVAFVEVGRTIGVVLTDGAVVVGNVVDVDSFVAVFAVEVGKVRLVPAMPEHCDDCR